MFAFVDHLRAEMLERLLKCRRGRTGPFPKWGGQVTGGLYQDFCLELWQTSFNRKFDKAPIPYDYDLDVEKSVVKKNVKAKS